MSIDHSLSHMNIEIDKTLAISLTMLLWYNVFFFFAVEQCHIFETKCNFLFPPCSKAHAQCREISNKYHSLDELTLTSTKRTSFHTQFENLKYYLIE